jgi:hypothetical protein
MFLPFAHEIFVNIEHSMDNNERVFGMHAIRA